MTRIAVIIAVVAALSAPARAAVVRYAVFIANNTGDADEQRLRYAEADAQRLHDVLRDLGGFQPENMVMLRGETAETVRRALIAVNDRVRPQGTSAELFVYYSGHADAGALHLGGSALDLGELEQLVRGSAASLRLLVVDACRSGALTRVKGGAIEPGFAIVLDQRIAGDGVVFWTASAASENAQESDALRGSFFTHYLASGLLGAADQDGDGAITLDEAYRYTYENTLRATSRTLAGTQHPTFRYEIAGRGDVVLTTPSRAGDQRAQLSFPPGVGYLVLQGNADGPVIAEVGVHDRARQLSVRPGRYFVRGRGADFLLEGSVVAAPGQRVAIREADLERIAYARLVRKGGERARVLGLEAGYAVHSSLWAGGSACQGAFAGAALELPFLTLSPRLELCRSRLSNRFLSTVTDELAVELAAARVWDAGRFTFSAGILAGGSVLHQQFSSKGIAPDRSALAAHLGVLAAATVDLVQGFYSGLEVGAMTYFYNQEAMDGVNSRSSFVARAHALLLGKHW